MNISINHLCLVIDIDIHPFITVHHGAHHSTTANHYRHPLTDHHSQHASPAAQWLRSSVSSVIPMWRTPISRVVIPKLGGELDSETMKRTVDSWIMAVKSCYTNYNDLTDFVKIQ